MPPEFGCPSDTARQPGVANHVAVVGYQTVWPEQYSASVRHVVDGTSNTVQVVESCDLHVPWIANTELMVATK